MKQRILAMVLVLSVFLPQAQALQAQEFTLDPGFDPNRVLEDTDIFDVTSMSYERMVSFMRSKGTLADTLIKDIDGIEKPASEIIWRVATSYKINPKYLLALLQKEQSLVEDRDPSQRQLDWAAGYGVCDSCSKDDPAIQDYKGFASQVEWAAKQHREKYLLQILGNGQTRAGKAPGKEMSVDGTTVTPTNNATAMLYSYTPHIHGNLNLWRIWRRWFSLSYPDGTLVRATGSDTTYIIRMGEKRPFASQAVLESLADTNKVITASDTELSAYPTGSTIRFPKFSLLQDPKKRIWLLTGEEKKQIADMKTFRAFGFNEDEIEPVEYADLADYATGTTITIKTAFPQGVVLQDSASKAYWYVENSVKQSIPDKTFLALYFKGRTIKKTTAAKLATYKTGEPYQLHDGELVRGVKSPAVYVVEDGLLRAIPSAETFIATGWSWKNVVTLPDAVLKPYTVGEVFGLNTLMATKPAAPLASL
jgi:hypothetical protein